MVKQAEITAFSPIDSQAAQFVARSSDNNLEMEKDWELMSELNKY